MERIKFSEIGWGQYDEITGEIMTKGSQLPNRIENRKSHDGIIVFLLISLISLYFIYNANVECQTSPILGECLSWFLLWWSCLCSTLLAFPLYAIFYRFGKNRKDPWEI